MGDADVNSAVAEAVDRHNLAGVAIAVVSRSEPPRFTFHGVADSTSRRPVEAGTAFRIASVSKTMTAIAVMQLEEDGLLSLDDPVNTHLKSFRVEPAPHCPPVTIRHLLTHTAGIGELPRMADLVNRRAFGLARLGAGPADLGALYRGVLRPEVAAGSKWAYANHGFAVLGQLVEEVAGAPFADYQREHLFDPLGMSHTDYLRTERVKERTALPHQFRLGRLRTLKDYDLTLLGPGSAWSTAADMAAYASALLEMASGNDTQVLKARTAAEMLRPQHREDPRLPGIGLAFFVDHLGSHRVAGHDGNVPGFASCLLFAPDDGVAVVVLTNTGTAIGAHLLGSKIMGLLLGTRERAAGSVAPSPHLWSGLVGHYAPDPGFLTNLRIWQVTGGELEVTTRRRHLVARAMSPIAELRRGVELVPVDEGDPRLFEATASGLTVPLVFRGEEHGQAAAVCIGGPVMATLRRRPWWRSSRLRLRAGAAAMTVAGLVAARRRRR